MLYYIYAYLRSRDSATAISGTPYYIGKGKKRRAYQRHADIPVPKDRSNIVIMERNLSEVGALALERRYIKWYGRKDLGTGILNNRTDGGEGVSGYVTPASRCAEISKANTGSGNGMFGKTHTDEVKLAIRTAKLGSKLTNEHKEAVGAAHRGTTLTAEHREKCSAKLSGINNPNYGKKISEEQKEKFRATMAAKKLLRDSSQLLYRFGMYCAAQSGV